MPIIAQTLCDGCQVVKKQTNHWYTLVVDDQAYEACLRPMSHTPPALTQLGTSRFLYFCGRHCAIEAIAQWMDREGECGQVQAASTPARSVR
jgi:hypothetical protein